MRELPLTSFEDLHRPVRAGLCLRQLATHTLIPKRAGEIFSDVRELLRRRSSVFAREPTYDAIDHEHHRLCRLHDLRVRRGGRAATFGGDGIRDSLLLRSNEGDQT